MTDPIDRAEAGFLAALAADPDDDTARLVYADWLDDRGDPRAALLRTHVRVRQLAARRDEWFSHPPDTPEGWEEFDALSDEFNRQYDLRSLLAIDHPYVWVDAACGPDPGTSGFYRGECGSHGYRRFISPQNPGCVVLLVSQASWLRTTRVAGGPNTIAGAIESTVNRWIAELITLCERGGEKPHDYFHVSLLGYGTDRDGRPVVRSLLRGALAGRDLVSIPDLYDHPLEIERRQKRELVDDGDGGLQEVGKEIAFPVWYRAGGSLWSSGPMCAGLAYARRVVADWVARHPDSFPPFVVHFSDGTSSDGNPAPSFESLKELRTDDGPMLLTNVCLSAQGAPPVWLPTAEEQLPDEASRVLFRGASRVPALLAYHLRCRLGVGAPPGCRAVGFNRDPLQLLRLLPCYTCVGYPFSLPTWPHRDR